MKYYIFVDTETTGLPKDWKAPVSDTDNWPRLVEIAWLIFDSDGCKISEQEFIIKPVNFTIPQETIDIHGITNELAHQTGHDLETVLMQFNKDLKQCDIIVGHNISFDINIIGAEFIRMRIPNNIAYMQQICTMKLSTDYCKLPGKFDKYKYPKLTELYAILFGKDMPNCHRAMDDIKATADCFWMMQKLGEI